MTNAHFGELTERMRAYRESVLESKPCIDAERAVLCTEAYRANRHQPAVMRRALMLKHILEHMTVYIEDQTLLAGNQASANRNAPIFPEYTLDFVMDELDTFEKRDGDVFYITEATKDDLRRIAPFWKDNNLRARGNALIPDEMAVYMETGLFGMEGKLNAGDAHLAVDYPELLRSGLRGYEARVKRLRSELDLCVPENIDKNIFYRAVLVAIQAVRDFAGRYAALAREMAESAEPARGKELLEIARVCEKVPYEPAETFQEALQSVWLIQVVLQIESNGHSLSYGRFDQYMYPYYEAGRARDMTDEQAVELLANLWIKTLTVNKVRSQAHTFSSAGSPMYQNVTIGGQTVEGKDAVNALSFLVLRSVAQVRLPQPNLTVRYHKNLDPDFMDEAIELMKLGTGMPAFNNDEIIIPCNCSVYPE